MMYKYVFHLALIHVHVIHVYTSETHCIMGKICSTKFSQRALSKKIRELVYNGMPCLLLRCILHILSVQVTFSFLLRLLDE